MKDNDNSSAVSGAQVEQITEPVIEITNIINEPSEPVKIELNQEQIIDPKNPKNKKRKRKKSIQEPGSFSESKVAVVQPNHAPSDPVNGAELKPKKKKKKKKSHKKSKKMISELKKPVVQQETSNNATSVLVGKEKKKRRKVFFQEQISK